MDGSCSMEDIRSDYGRMKEELSSAMLHCIPSYEQYNRVMLTLTELLFEAIDSIHRKKSFQTSALRNAFDVMESCNTPANDQEVVLLKFARAFVLFMDSLNGSSSFKQMVASGNGQVFMTTKSKISMQDMGVKRDPPKRRRLIVPLPNRSPIWPTGRIPGDPVPGEIIIQTGSLIDLSNMSNPMVSHTEIKLEPESESSGASMVAVESSALPFFASAPGGSQIKEEEIDDDEEPAESAHVKEEPIKEEPLEAPIADRIRITSRPSHTAVQLGKSRNVNHLFRQPPSLSDSRKMTPIYSVRCPYCFAPKDLKHLEEHIKVNHKTKWLRHVTKCPDKGCDFRTEHSYHITKHRKTYHTEKYKNWIKTLKDIFMGLTRCPYCPRQIKEISEFIDHMEKDHPRLCTYEVHILQCNSCPLSAHSCFQMLYHWASSPQCRKGMRFLYESAAKVMEIDRAKARDEVILAPSPPPSLPSTEQ